MSSSGPSKNDSQDDADGNGKENNCDAEDIKKCEELLTNFESRFVAIMKDLIKKFGEPFTEDLKVLLECSICTGLLNSAVSRQCLHTFCKDCIIHWIATNSSNGCPMCRDDIIVHVKNPVVDEVVKMLVNISFIEKEERSSEIHRQLPARNAHFTATSKNQQGEEVTLKLHPDSSILGRGTCALMVHSLVCEVLPKFQLAIDDGKNESDILLRQDIKMFLNDWESLYLVYNNIPQSILSASMYE